MRRANENEAKIFVVSDSIGETAQRVINAVLAQFPTLTDIEIKKFPFINSEEDLVPVLADALQEKAIVVTTLVDEGLNQRCATFARKTGLRYIDYMSDLIRMVSEQTNVEPVYKSGSLHQLDREYFDRIEAVEFAVRYDDGKDAKGFLKSDIVILGISRTSKTPLSMYLANKSYKVSNLPLIPEVPVPQEIFQIEPRRLIGLTAEPEYIMNVRQARLSSLGLGGESAYVNLDRIKNELAFSQELYENLGATVVNVKNKSIEEVAQCIEQHLQEK
ncbi:pyruvate, water dikinase regulatory protein [Vagococcus acidifermentans]|uniref:Putative pyruvate, phosphate dikinase regulatory protein n=1 Tax=Vagococcus acidifermentans TaxID=564710 RepID=A0A430AS77_9ENTE|nr:pyruvate, water dikinase regulatory protein [Vagococcus acidifermentans]RSU10903.1 phosphoenolpyruvate synthase regulatory protein [Vagococcus acidifermentans]